MIQPLGRRILVKYLPETAPLSPLAVGVPRTADTVRWATVLRTGSGCRHTTKGDRVLVSSLQGVAVGSDFQHVIPEQAVLLKMT